MKMRKQLKLNQIILVYSNYINIASMYNINIKNQKFNNNIYDWHIFN